MGGGIFKAEWHLLCFEKVFLRSHVQALTWTKAYVSNLPASEEALFSIQVGLGVQAVRLQMN